MKGIILAGGSGTRLHPLTLAVNKHLLPVYNKPVIYHAVQTLVNAGIDRIMIVTSPQSIDHFVRLIGSGKDFISKRTGTQIQVVYGIQNVPSGIAYGLHIARDYIGDDSCALHLGDNIFEDDFSDIVKNFKSGATVFLKKVKDPERFGVASVDKRGRVKKITEKPKRPDSDLAVTGLYIYDNSVFAKLEGQTLSDRGELEITDVNNRYVKEGTLRALILKDAWFDIGTPDSLLAAAIHMHKKYGKKK